ncbi:MAG TPA: inositol monophosphatase family protein [Candidatus Dormibacteraeota bacterium]
MIVRRARLEDRAAVVELVALMGGHEEVAAMARPLPSFPVLLASPSARALVAVVRGHVVGYAEIQARPATLHDGFEAWLAVLAVHPQLRGSGIGARLVAECEREARLLGCQAIVLESSDWRERTHAFYERLGFAQDSPARRFRRAIAPGPEVDGPLEAFYSAAARAATIAAELAAELQSRARLDGTKGADEIVERAVVEELRVLGLPIVGEERGGPDRIAVGQRWIALDPIDATRNYRVGRQPWAISIGLVAGDAPEAGFVADLSSGRRWWGDPAGAYADGRRIMATPNTLLAMPSPRPGSALEIRPGFERVRVSGCTAMDVCGVADGSVGGFDGSRLGEIYAQDVAAALAILAGAGGLAATPDGEPVRLEPDPKRQLRIIAAADEAGLNALRDAAVAAVLPSSR